MTNVGKELKGGELSKPTKTPIDPIVSLIMSIFKRGGWGSKASLAAHPPHRFRHQC